MLSTFEFSSPLFVRVQIKKHPSDDDYDFEKGTVITGFIIPTHFDHAVDGRKLLYKPEGFYTPEYFYLALLTPNKPQFLSSIKMKLQKSSEVRQAGMSKSPKDLFFDSFLEYNPETEEARMEKLWKLLSEPAREWCECFVAVKPLVERLEHSQRYCYDGIELTTPNPPESVVIQPRFVAEVRWVEETLQSALIAVRMLSKRFSGMFLTGDAKTMFFHFPNEYPSYEEFHTIFSEGVHENHQIAKALKVWERYEKEQRDTSDDTRINKLIAELKKTTDRSLILETLNNLKTK